MSDYPVLPGKTVTAPRPSTGGAVWDGGAGSVNQLTDVVYDNYFTCWTAEECAAQWAAEMPTQAEPTVLDEVIVHAPIAPPAIAAPSMPSVGFQGPMPAPAPGGGGVPQTPPTATPAPAPAPQHPYSIPKPGPLRRLRFVLEDFLKKVLPGVRNVIPRLPTPITFVADALLAPTPVADATVWGPGAKNLPLPIEQRDTWTLLPEQSVRAPAPMPIFFPSIITQPMEVPSWTPLPQPLPLPLPLPLPFPLPSFNPTAIPEMTPSPSLKPSPLPTQWPLPMPNASPMPLELPLSTPMPIAVPGIPSTVPAPGIVPSIPPAVSPFNPSLPSLNTPSFPAPGITPLDASICPPCSTTKPKGEKAKERKQRMVCYRGTYTELRKGLIKRKKVRVPCR